MVQPKFLSSMVVVALLLLTGCQSGAATPPAPTPLPTQTAGVVATSTVAPTATVQAEATTTESGTPTSAAENETETPAGEFASGGLGLDRAVWEETHTAEGEGFLEAYDGGAVNGGYDVLFNSATDRALLIYRFFESRVSESDAIATGEALMPADGELVDTYTFEESSPNVVRVYFSASLANRFDADAFEGDDPGTFIIMYTLYEDGAETLLITTGNNP